MQTEWDGDWGDRDPRWTVALREQFRRLHPEDSDDGVFWMSMRDFGCFFDIVVTLAIRDGWHSEEGSAVSCTLRVSRTAFVLDVMDAGGIDMNVIVHAMPSGVRPLPGVRMRAIGSHPGDIVGSTSNVYMIAPIVCTDVLRVAMGSHVILVEVYGVHVDPKWLPVSAVVGVYSSSSAVKIREAAAEDNVNLRPGMPPDIRRRVPVPPAPFPSPISPGPPPPIAAPRPILKVEKKKRPILVGPGSPILPPPPPIAAPRPILKVEKKKRPIPVGPGSPTPPIL
jgi:hypothetical protein